MNKSTTILLAALLLTAGLHAAEPRLNVMLITLDDLNYDSLGYNGCPMPGISPNLDRLARSGMRFDHAYVLTSMCGPSRAVMLTGRYPHSNGIMGHGKQPPPGWQPPAVPTPNLMRLLRAHGYFTAGILKWKQSVKAEEFDLTWNEGPYGIHRDDRNPAAFYQRTRESIAQARKAKKPFFLYVNPVDPHDPWPGTAFETELRKKWNPDDPSPPPARYFKPEEVFVPPFLPDLPAIRQHIAPYYASVHRGDQCVGRILDALEDAGERERTLIIFCSDHGMGVPGSKWSMFDPSTRTPVIICWPGRVAPGSRNTTHVISTVDFAPTFLEAVGVPAPVGMDGHSLLPLLAGRSPANWPEHAYLEQNYFGNCQPDEFYPIRCMVTRTHLYIWNAYVSLAKEPRPYYQTDHEVVRLMENSGDARAMQRARDYIYRPVEQLYRIDSDPGCWKNLVGQAASEAVLQKMRAALGEKLSSTADPQWEHFRQTIGGAGTITPNNP